MKPVPPRATLSRRQSATLSTPVGASSLGNYIFGGLQTRNHAAVLVGCIAAAAMDKLARSGDDEVRGIVREVLDAVDEGTPLERIALLWGSDDPVG